jgi:hypothetical protein
VDTRELLVNLTRTINQNFNAEREGNPRSDKDPEARERESSRPRGAHDGGTAFAWNRRAIRFPPSP